MNCGECDIDFACAKEGVSCIRLASPAAPAPGDMVMVPREPTPDMARAGRKAVAAVADKMEAAKQLAVNVIDFWQQVGHTPANEIYRAMIAAAPPAAPASVVPLTDAQKQRIHDETGAGHALICLVESYIHGIGGGNG